MATEWINRRKEQADREKQDLTVEAARDRISAQTIKADGPVYWDSLLSELNAQCVDMDDLGYQAKACSLDNPFLPQEKTYRIDIQIKEHPELDAHALLIYRTGSQLITVISNITNLSKISLCATERGIKAISDKDMTKMDVKKLAAYLLEGLVEAIEKDKRSSRPY